MTFNLKEVRKELEPKKPEIVYKPWVKGVKNLPNVIYFKVTDGSEAGDTPMKIMLICVNYLGEKLNCGNIIGITEDNKLFYYNNINQNLGLNLDEYGQLLKVY